MFLRSPNIVGNYAKGGELVREGVHFFATPCIELCAKAQGKKLNYVLILSWLVPGVVYVPLRIATKLSMAQFKNVLKY